MNVDPLLYILAPELKRFFWHPWLNESKCGRFNQALYQWPFQDPKLEVPTIYKAYLSGLCKGIYPKIWPEIWYSTSILGSWNSHWLYGDCMVTNWGKAWRCSRWKPNAWRLGDWFNHQRLIWACLGWTRNIWGLTIKSEDKRSCNVG